MEHDPSPTTRLSFLDEYAIPKQEYPFASVEVSEQLPEEKNMELSFPALLATPLQANGPMQLFSQTSYTVVDLLDQRLHSLFLPTSTTPKKRLVEQHGLSRDLHQSCKVIVPPFPSSAE